MTPPTPDPSPDSNSGYNIDELLNQLISAKLPKVLPQDELLAAHEAMSVKMGASEVRKPENAAEKQELAEFTERFRRRIWKNHAVDAREIAGILVHGTKIDVMKSGEKAFTAIVEVRGRDGSSIVPNKDYLCRTSDGPVFLWVRSSPLGLQVSALYSKAAFAAEIGLLRNAGAEIFASDKEFPLLLSYMLKALESKAESYGKPDLKIAALQPLNAPGAFRMSSNYGSIDCTIVRNDNTCSISYQFTFPRKLLG